MKLKNSLLVMTMIVTAIGVSLPVKADTVEARCDVYPKGEDRATSSGICTFSQRQGAVGIQLENGERYDLRPVGDKPGNYQDNNGRAAYRQSGLGDRGQIYRLFDKSIYVYWDTAPYGQNQSSSTSSPNIARGISTLRANDSNSRINVRTQATINSSAPQYGLTGDQVRVLECVEDQDTIGSDLNWCKVEFVKSRAVGWIRSDFIIFADGGE
ncbi:SH3 domain-containing protein [Crocosphaera sp.]|uniref:SH3 domain-containing protein n=1 Tax=Crocosphaera sp. TaxID=2729996 RepID=UPI0026231CBD|nr:SH3 domain-containing protein [Crocosphaera sp.]MDJ0582681.1 SH3 domain-containing protein [Crocosphaera sp.]